MKNGRMNMEMKTSFDYTMMSTYHVCHRKYNFRFNRNLVRKETALPLEFGRVIHAALDFLYTAWDVEGAVALFKAQYKENLELDDKRTVAMGEWILRNYADHYANQPWKLVHSEMPFEVELPTGKKLMGRIDKIIEWDGVLWVVDHKTTSGLGASYFKMAEPNAQFMGYTFAARKLGFPVVGTVIDAMLVAKGLLDSKSRAKLTPLARYDAHVSDELMVEWLQWAVGTQNMIAYDEKNEFWIPNYESCTYYGECPYRSLCKEIPALREKIIGMDYKEEVWSPVQEKGE
jgi:hypothetical protein